MASQQQSGTLLPADCEHCIEKSSAKSLAKLNGCENHIPCWIHSPAQGSTTSKSIVGGNWIQREPMTVTEI